jgi:hypothetical protein
MLQLIFNAKMNFSWLMLVYVGLIMLAAYFCHSPLSQVEYNSALIKVDWLAACVALRVVGAVYLFSSGVGIKFAQSFSQWEARADTLKKCHKPG